MVVAWCTRCGRLESDDFVCGPPFVPSNALPPRPLSVAVHFVGASTSKRASNPYPVLTPTTTRPLAVCMRFGCGARLPAHGASGNVCEACATAGFTARPAPQPVGVPPPAPGPRRLPRRIMPRALRILHTVDLAPALEPRSIHTGSAAETTLERTVIDSDEEVDLVYPDDVPAPPIPSDSGSGPQTEAAAVPIPVPAEEEEDELELVYPDDVVEAACAALLSNPRTRSLSPPPPPPPTTLRDFFKGSLRTLPACIIVPPDERPPPRQCRTPGCEEVLSPQTYMERCVRCSVSDWKQRRLEARRPSACSLRTTTTMEEKEVAEMVDDMDMSAVGDEYPSSKSESPAKERRISGWDSDLTELSDSDSSSDSGSDMSISDSGVSCATTVAVPPHIDTDITPTRLRIRIPLLATRLPPDSPFRKCGNKRCNIAVRRKNRWKTCDPCRRAQRTYQRLRFENLRRRALGLDELGSVELVCHRQLWRPRSLSRSVSPDSDWDLREVQDMVLAPGAPSRPCSVQHCRTRIPLASIYRWKTCVECRKRARREARRKKFGVAAGTTARETATEVVPRFQAYQNRGALVAALKAQLRGFVEGQLVYLRTKLRDAEGWAGVDDADVDVMAAAADGSEEGGGCRRESTPWRAQGAPMMFVFAGEYSIVIGSRSDTGDGDRIDRRGSEMAEEAMRQEVSRVVVDLERVVRARFRQIRPSDAFAIDGGGILVRFTCSPELIAWLRPLASSSGGNSSVLRGSSLSVEDVDEGGMESPAAEIPLVKTLSGELEVVVVPDDSHRFFYGRRTVVRYRMVG